MSFPKRVGRTPEQQEMCRILELPVRPLPDPEDVEIGSFERMNVEAFTLGERLFPVQVAAVAEYEEVEGLLAKIGVGAGKTGICLMIAQAAMAKGLKKILWLMPVQLVEGAMKRHIPEWRRRVPLSLTFHMIAGRSYGMRKRLAQSGAPGVYIFPYSLLSRPDTLDMLQAIKPELVIADEVHNLKNARSGRTQKLMSVLQGVQFVGMSGTMTAKGIGDYHHLASASLGIGSPLPLAPSVAFRWGLVLDVGTGGYPDPHMRSTFKPMIEWAKDRFPEEEFPDDVEGCRHAFQHRLTSAPGVIQTTGLPGASLLITNHESGDPSPELLGLIEQVAVGYDTPEGEPIDHAIHTHKWLRELSAGFYNSLVWPSIENLVKYRKISENDAGTLLVRSQLHLEDLKRYRRELRSFFDSSPPELSMPMEVGRDIFHYGANNVGEELASLWREAKDSDFPGRLKRLKVPVRVCDYKIRAAVEWAKKAGCGIMWVYHKEVGVWLTEALTEAGLNPLHCPSKADAEIEAVGDPRQGGKGDRLVVASIAAHGEGRNLQAFYEQLFVETPRSPNVCEQAIGRCHREEQDSDVVIIHTMLALEWDHQHRSAMLNDALYIQQTTRTQQKVIYADYSPLPEVYPASFLKARGFNPKDLAEGELKERFNDDV